MIVWFKLAVSKLSTITFLTRDGVMLLIIDEDVKSTHLSSSQMSYPIKSLILPNRRKLKYYIRYTDIRIRY